MKMRALFAGMFILLNACISLQVWAHCEIPCGIYGDEARFEAMLEDVKTVEKSMNKIVELSNDPKANMNQIVRWVENKDVHADKISNVVTQYFLKQRIKPVNTSAKKDYLNYTKKLALLHQIMFHSMKAKQTTDLTHTDQMATLITEFHREYHPEEFK